MGDEQQGLGDRQGLILTAIVQEFIRRGDPVGSKSIVGRYHLDVSSATVRNDMSLLEEFGYLTQPHTSAGRIPTDLGYRYFVDHVRQPIEMEPERRREVDEELRGIRADVEDLMTKAGEVLSRLTRQATAILPPTLTGAKLRHVDLVRLAPRLVLVVLITDTGLVEKSTVELDVDAAQEEIDGALTDLNRVLQDVRLTEAEAKVADLMRAARAGTKRVFQGARDAISVAVGKEHRMILGGASMLAADQTFVAIDDLRRVYEGLERQHSLVRALAEGMSRPVSVRIGHELEDPDLRACSVVVAGYDLGDGGVGSVGVIGPTRMDYEQAMAITQAVARAIADQLGSLGG